MSSGPPSSCVPLLLFFLSVQSIDSAEAPPLSGLQPPEVDGSAVDEPCRIYPVPTPSSPTPTTTTTRPPHTRKHVMATPKTPAVQSPPRKPTSQATGAPIRKQATIGAPIRKQAAIGAPITNSLSTPGSHLLYHLLANSRRHPAIYSPQLPGYWVLPGNRLVSQPIGGLPFRANSVMSWNKESLATLLKRGYTHPAGHTHTQKDSFSSEDSSDD